MMNKIIITLSLIASCLVASAQDQPVKTAKGYEVKIKTSAVCEMCKYAIEKDLAFEKGVKESDLDVDSKVLTVLYNGKKTDADKIRKRVTEVGYHADNFARNEESYNKLPPCCQDGAHGREKPHHPDGKH
ncbi:MAG: heavy-metal-associated domain-containing protein [Cyclobacteriaceae bacterium]